jgi:hypothetical protein
MDRRQDHSQLVGMKQHGHVACAGEVREEIGVA